MKSTRQETCLSRFFRPNQLLKGLIVAFLAVCIGAFGLSAAQPGKVKSQTVTLTVANEPLKDVLSKIESQTGYLFVVNNNINTADPVSLTATSEALPKVLDRMLKGKGIYFAIEGSNIVLTRNRPLAVADEDKSDVLTTITGRVFDEEGEPAIGASVRIKGAEGGVVTDVDGNFTLRGNFTPSTQIEVSYVGMKPVTRRAGSGKDLAIQLATDANKLNEGVA
ncbi:MAG: carboxypeptidase-like regulatory domain-containing protein, partial [Muribaculaceae bacterium]|nr:carboxypeptidase-like regulatory domain-containing protein [Muribaculaceae bacterium]